MTVIYHKQIVKVEKKTVFSGFLCVCLSKSWNLRPSKLTKKFDTGLSV